MPDLISPSLQPTPKQIIYKCTLMTTNRSQKFVPYQNLSSFWYDQLSVHHKISIFVGHFTACCTSRAQQHFRARSGKSLFKYGRTAKKTYIWQQIKPNKEKAYSHFIFFPILFFFVIFSFKVFISVFFVFFLVVLSFIFLLFCPFTPEEKNNIWNKTDGLFIPPVLVCNRNGVAARR